MNSEEVIVCHHCGSQCDHTSISYENLSFCCNGCYTVYSILKECKLDNYYAIENVPGIKPEIGNNNFSFLELPEVLDRIIQYEDDRMVKMKLFIPDIHCASCIYLLENLSKIDRQVISSRVDFSKKELTISAENKKPILQSIFSLLYNLGYRPNLESNDHKINDEASKSLLIQLGIAGFCFGNIMLLSIPGYLSIKSMTPSLAITFLVISLLLTIPVLIFGAKDYYVKAFKSLKQKYLSIEVPIALGITALLVNSLIDILIFKGAGYLDSLAGLVFFLLIGKWIQAKTYDQFSFEKDLRSFFPLAVLKKEKDNWKTTRVSELNKNDIIQLRHGEILPVNAILLDDTATFDYSFVTGESETIYKQKEDSLFAGGKLTSATNTFKVESPMDQSYFAELWQNQNPLGNKGIKNLLDKVSHYFTITIITIALAGGLYWLTTGSIQKALFVFTSTLIVACPCALALALPFTYGSADRILGSNGIYLKHFRVLELLEKISLVVLDKTGTLTRSDGSKTTYQGGRLSEQLQNSIKAITASSIHPLSQMINASLQGKTEDITIDFFEETAGKGIKAKIKGESDTIYIGSKSFLLESGLNSIQMDDISIDSNKTSVYLGINKSIYGLFEIGDQYRSGIVETIAKLQEKFKVVILSGDKKEKAFPLKEVISNENQIQFEQSPIDKLNYIKKAKHKHKVLMIGDGINDAAALNESNVGISIIEQSGHFTPASDIIMKGSKVNTIPTLLQYAKDCQKILYIGLGVSFFYNSIGIYFAFNGWLSPFVAAILMPISSVTVVALSTSLTYSFAKRRKLTI